MAERQREREREREAKLYVRCNLCIKERSGKYSTVIPSHLCTAKYACTAVSVVSQEGSTNVFREPVYQRYH